MPGGYCFSIGLLLALLFATADGVSGHNQYNGGYRKFPWKADAVRSITTLPNTPPHSGESNQLAIDLGMSYEKVYSISPGTYVEFVDRYCFGWTLTVNDKDGSYITYSHLDTGITPPSGAYIAGLPIAKSGNSGSEDNTPQLTCSSGAHLHFARYGAAPSFTMNDRNIQASLEPISAHGGGIDTLDAGPYTGDNAGIGYDSTDTLDFYYVSGYSVLGAYSGWGVTAQLPDNWSPCRNDGILGTWWRYTCSPHPCCTGTVQTYKGALEKKRAIMHGTGQSAFGLHQGILAAYTEIYFGQDWVYWIGYPTGNRHWHTPLAPDVFEQHFVFGRVVYDTSPCREDMYQYDNYITSYSFCD